MTTASVARLSFQHVTKTFEATVALSDVSLDVAPAEIHALLGANGAGKSTLIKILAGIYALDDGAVLVDGLPDHSEVRFIHQELGLVDTMTVGEAIAMTRGFATQAGLINWSRVRSDAANALELVGATIRVDAMIGDLSRADRSVVAIARAVASECKVLVLDEPTASLPDHDVSRLFEILATLRANGVSIVYVTHRLDEVYRIADVVTVLRDGRLVRTAPLAEVTPDELVSMIVGGALPAKLTLPDPQMSDRGIALEGVRLSSEGPSLGRIAVRSGEILGLAGLRGSGHELIGRGIAGLTTLDIEQLIVDKARRIPARDRQRWLLRNVGFASSRREKEGLAMALTVRENLFLNPAATGRKAWSWIWPPQERSNARRITANLQVKPRDPGTVAGTLSGGNQQKVILGRLLESSARTLVLEEPTMGIDVGARAEIYRVMATAAESGRSVVAVSSDFEELALVCHRVLVFDRGAIAAELSGDAITADAITHYCSAGAAPGDKHA
jgi:ribose transport system ATP-binding protein